MLSVGDEGFKRRNSDGWFYMGLSFFFGGLQLNMILTTFQISSKMDC